MLVSGRVYWGWSKLVPCHDHLRNGQVAQKHLRSLTQHIHAEKKNSSFRIIGYPDIHIVSQQTGWYCWWLKSCTSWYIVYPIIYKVSAPSQVVVWDFRTINSRNGPQYATIGKCFTTRPWNSIPELDVTPSAPRGGWKAATFTATSIPSRKFDKGVVGWWVIK